MRRFDVGLLDEFYSRISAEGGLSVTEFLADLSGMFNLPRSAEDINNYRLNKRPWKKLSDEVVPVSRYLRFHKFTRGKILFPLDDGPADAWLTDSNHNTPSGIQVTIARGTERHHLAKELVNEGLGRGFIGLSDDAPRSEFKIRMSKKRIMYTAEQALSATKAGIIRCLLHKNRPEFNGFLLLVQAPLSLLARERWHPIIGDLQTEAASLPFREIHVISETDEPWGFQLK